MHIIYITGLGDAKASWQKRAVGGWRIYGVTPHFFRMNWEDGEAWPIKFKRLLDLIDELGREGHAVALVGVSAGAGVAINAFAARKTKLAGVVLIAGKINRPETIDEAYARNTPAFLPSARLVPESLARLSSEDRRRLNSRYGVIDEIVPMQDSFIPRAVNRRVLGFGHAFTIAEQITFGAPHFIRFLKRLAKD